MALEDHIYASLGAYAEAPDWLRHVAGALYRTVPRRVRYGGRYPAFDEDARTSLFDASWPEIERRIDSTLQAAAGAPAYAAYAAAMQDRRRGALERLRELPLMTKADLKRDPESHTCRTAGARQRLETFTGGSTAQPMRFFLHRHVTRPRESAYMAHIERSQLDARASEWTLSMRGRTVRSAGSRGGRVWRTDPVKRQLVFSSDHLEAGYMPAYVSALVKLRPAVIHAFPSALYPLARWLREHPAPEFTDNVRGILLTSENVYDFQSLLFRQVFPAARVVEHYGHSERVLMAMRSPRDDGYRFCPLYGFPELIGEDGRIVDRPGVLGEIVGTSFDNHVMPFVRYRTGDMGMWLERPLLAGRVRLAMRRIEGRRQEFVMCADGRLISITTLGAAHFNDLASVESIQFEQHEPGRLTLKVVSARPLPDADRARIAASVRDKTQGGCTVDVLKVAAIERTDRGKHRMLLQHLDISNRLGAAVLPLVEDGLLQPEADEPCLP